MPIGPEGKQQKGDIQNLQELLRLGIAVVTELWAYPTKDWVTAVHAADVDGDGDIEVIIGSRDGNIFALTRLGIPKWGARISSEWAGTVFALDGTEALNGTRIVVGSRDNKVYGLDESGQELWSYATDLVARQIYVSDINQDGRDEVIVGSEDRCIHVIESDTGKLLWKYSTDAWVRTVYAFDVDNDGAVEILGGSGDKYLYVLDNTGSLKWKYNAESKIYALVVADLDGDGTNEILISTDAKDLYVLTPDLQKKWQFKPENRILSIAVADLNGDGHLEVIAGSEDKHLYFLNDQGELLWKYNLGARAFNVFLIDLDRDGLLEVLVGADDDSIHVLRVELTRGLREKIFGGYHALGSPPLMGLTLSPTESFLLQDFISEHLENQKETSPLDVKGVSTIEDPLRTLAMLLTLHEQKVQTLWMRELGYVRTLDLADITGDGMQEMVIGTGEGKVYALDTTGTALWVHTIGDRIRTLQIGDIDQDGDAEIVVGSINGRVYALSRDGKDIRWRSKMGNWITSIYINSATKQKPAEVIMGTESKSIYIYAGSFPTVTGTITTPQGIQIVCANDINRDGITEIIAGAVDDNVYAYAPDGALLWSYKTWDRVRAVCAIDINADGYHEILVGSEDRTVYVLDNQGHLKWRYYTAHRVLDVTAMDIDQDGNVEVLLGVGDGQIYVLSSEGNLLWRYKVNDRVRFVRAADVDQDGSTEVIVGSEDRLYLLRVLKLPQLLQQIEQCWQILRQQRQIEELLVELSQQSIALLRAYALRKFAHQPELLEQKLDLLQKFISDPSSEVRLTFAQVLPMLYRAYPDYVRRSFEALLADRERDVRLALVESIPAIVQINKEVGFAYFDRLTRSVDMWVRHTVVRKLYELVEPFPQQSFRLLLATTQDEVGWIRLESARTLAHYFDLHMNNLIAGARALIAKGVDLSVYDLISQRTSNPVVANVFHVIVDFFFGLDETNVQARLEGAVRAFEETKNIKYGEEMWLVYRELYRLHRMRTIEEIARYKYVMDESIPANTIYFEDTLRLFPQITSITNSLAVYLRREGLGDRLASLLEATTNIEALYTSLEGDYLRPLVQKSRLSERLIFAFLLKRWRNIVTTELIRLRGKADLRLELQTRIVQQEEYISVWVTIRNEGNSPADTVRVILRASQDFSVISEETIVFETIPSRSALSGEFTIKANCARPHLTFELIYSDASSKEEKMLFGERLEIQETKQEFRRIPNPYKAGAPIHDQEMFYGRKEDLEFLRKNLTNTMANTAIVLYGQRRSGKTSLLYQLVNTPILSPHIPVYIDMQNESLGINIGKFLRDIAYYTHRALKNEGLPINRPNLKDFDEDPTFVFNLFLDDAESLLGERKLVILIDEFDILEQKVNEKALPREIFEYLRSLMQHRRGINFLFAGARSIEQLTAGYWSVFFNIARHHRISMLGEEASAQLITRPVEGFLEYDSFAIKKIQQLTANQPFLIQLVCRALVDHCNLLQKNYVTINDVNTVLDDVMETGEIHFKWIWEQATQEERILLSILAQEGGEERRLLSLADIEEVYEHHGLLYNQKKVLQALRELTQNDIIESASKGTHFRILLALSQRWLRETKSLRRVMLEENLPA